MMGIFEILHAIGLVLGFGGAAISCALMLNLKTDDIRLRRGKIARKICIVTWISLAILIISGLVLTMEDEKNYENILTIKHILVVIITIDAVIIHLRLFPRYFKNIGTAGFDKTYSLMKRIGILSMTCWVLTIILSGFLEG